MIDGSEKCNCQLAFELQNSHVIEKHSKRILLTNSLGNVSEISLENLYVYVGAYKSDHNTLLPW